MIKPVTFELIAPPNTELADILSAAVLKKMKKERQCQED